MLFRSHFIAVLLVATLSPAFGFADDSEEPGNKNSQEPLLELALRAGPMISMPGATEQNIDDPSLNWEIIHAALGIYAPGGALSAYYSYNTDQNACGLKNEEVGISGQSDLESCTGNTQQFGGYYRLIGSVNRLSPWIGLGLAYYTRAGNGKRTFAPYPDCYCDGANRTNKVRRNEDGLYPFLLLGGEYSISERMALGADFQSGYQETTITGNLGLRVSYKVY